MDNNMGDNEGEVRRPHQGKAETEAQVSQPERQIGSNVAAGDNEQAQQKRMVHAVWHGRLDEVRQLCSRGAQVNFKWEGEDSDESYSPLMFAASFGHVKIVELLLKMGADINLRCSHKRTALMSACFSGQVDAVRILLEFGGDIMARDEFGMSPLLFAAKRGHIGAIQVIGDLCKSSLDDLITQKNNRGLDALSMAVYYGHANVVRELIELGANVSTVTDLGYPLILAVSREKIDSVLVLIEAGASCNYKYIDGATALHFAAAKGNIKIIEVLVKHGASVNEMDNQGKTPIFHAAGLNHAEAVALLASLGALLDVHYKHQFTPTFLAAFHGAVDAIDALADCGANISIPDVDSRSPISIATETGHNSVVKILAEKYCVDVNCKDVHGYTPLHVAAQVDNDEAIRILVDSGANIHALDKCGATPLHEAARKGCLKAIKKLVELGARVDAGDGQGATAVHYAAQCDHSDAIKMLSNFGASVGVKYFSGYTPMFIAAHSGSVKAMQALFDLGADIAAIDDDNRSALFIAAEMGHVGAIQLLASLGADVNMDSWEGVRPIQIAAVKGNCDVIRTLVELGACPECCDDKMYLQEPIANSTESTVSTLIDLGVRMKCAEQQGTVERHCKTLIFAFNGDAITCFSKDTVLDLISLNKLMIHTLSSSQCGYLSEEAYAYAFTRILQQSSIFLHSVVSIIKIPYSRRAQICKLAGGIFLDSLLTDGDRLKEIDKAMRYTELIFFFFNKQVLTDVFSLRLTCSTTNYWMRFPVLHSDEDLEAHLIEGFLACKSSFVVPTSSVLKGIRLHEG